MKANIDVKDRREADAIRSGLGDPVVRAFVLIVGVLKELPSDRARARVMTYVHDKLDEERAEDNKAAEGNSGNPAA